ncbi:HSPB1-associated protein 1 homolog isoform 3-T6 [Spinachia spinachia]
MFVYFRPSLCCTWRAMAASTPPKPFGPEEARRLLGHLQTPAVFPDMAAGWPALLWTAERLSRCLGDRVVRFRLGRKKETNAPLFETQCSYVEATLEHFLSWTLLQTGSCPGPFCEYPSSEYWAYADYKYIALLLQDRPAMFQDVRWSDFGFEGRDGRESTLWVASEGANTPCHLDSYGCNLVLQVEGRKRWHLFPPEDTPHLYPTRIPYEESSVFSQVHVVHPDLRRFPLFRGSRAHEVILQPGEVLFVPRHWWHYVESLDPVTVSINSWIELRYRCLRGGLSHVVLLLGFRSLPGCGHCRASWRGRSKGGSLCAEERGRPRRLAQPHRGGRGPPPGQHALCEPGAESLCWDVPQTDPGLETCSSAEA